MMKPQTYLPLRVAVIGPPANVVFALQRGKDELASSVISTGDDLTFEFSVRLGGKEDEWPNFLGPFAQGPRGARFVYVNSGTSAGQSDSCWTRRAKVALKGISWELVDRVLANPSGILEARIAGMAKDGGPACASVPLLNGGWTIVTKSGIAGIAFRSEIKETSK